MSYKVFARKWRPLNFAQIVGQEHVVRALVNALENKRLHHAYLFTGTRGVGKTTIARVLAKALNCPNLNGAEPCGQCETCLDVDRGRYPDLIEVDAASRTGVDDTRDLLDNVQYLPSRGQYKIYLIDEVHMFSKSSFNALLKTLEEPPEHVKFLLATTDPQKMPVTVLSRCLQFNLKRLLPKQIEGQFETILQAEGLEYESAATGLLAKAADGSMRDGLSLLDQAIVHGSGGLIEAEVLDMLGSVAREPLLALVKALLTQKGTEVLSSIQALDEFAPDYEEVLQSLLVYLHQIAICQMAATGDEDASIKRFANALTTEDVQLYYQIALIGQKDLALAPTPKVGFEMVLLRMLTFTPLAPTELMHSTEALVTNEAEKPQQISRSTAVDNALKTPAKTTRKSPPLTVGKRTPRLVVHEKKNTEKSSIVSESGTKKAAIPVAVEVIPVPVPVLSSTSVDGTLAWHEVVPMLGLDPMTLQLANNTTLARLDDKECELLLMGGHVSLNKKSEMNLQQALCDYYGRRLQLILTSGKADLLTPNSIASQKVEARQQQAVSDAMSNELVKKIITEFDAKIIDGSIKPID